MASAVSISDAVSDERVEAFRRDGFAVVSDLLTEAELDRFGP